LPWYWLLVLLANPLILHADNVGGKAREKRGTRAIACANPPSRKTLDDLQRFPQRSSGNGWACIEQHG